MEAGELGFPGPAPNQVKYLEVAYAGNDANKKIRVKAGNRMELP
jgi:hypothetical protein